MYGKGKHKLVVVEYQHVRTICVCLEFVKNETLNKISDQRKMAYKAGSRMSLCSAAAVLPPTVVRRIELRKEQRGIDFGFVLTGERPAIFSNVQPASLAAQAGVRTGDVLLAVNGLSVDEAAHEEIVALVAGSSGAVVLLVTEDEFYRLGISFAGSHSAVDELPADERSASHELWRVPSSSSSLASREPGEQSSQVSGDADGSVRSFRDSYSYDLPSPPPLRGLASPLSTHGLTPTETETTAGDHSERSAMILSGASSTGTPTPGTPRHKDLSLTFANLELRARVESSRRAGNDDFRPSLAHLGRSRSRSEGAIDAVALQVQARRLEERTDSQSSRRFALSYYGDFLLDEADLSDHTERRRLLSTTTATFRREQRQSSLAQLHVSRSGVSVFVKDDSDRRLWWPRDTLVLVWVDPADEQLLSLIRRSPLASAKGAEASSGRRDHGSGLTSPSAHVFRTHAGSSGETTNCGQGQTAEHSTVDRLPEQANDDAAAADNVLSAWTVVNHMRQVYDGRLDHRPDSATDDRDKKIDKGARLEGSRTNDDEAVNDAVRLVNSGGSIDLFGLALLTRARAGDSDSFGQTSTPDYEPDAEREECASESAALGFETQFCTPIYFEFTRRATGKGTDFEDVLSRAPPWIVDSLSLEGSMDDRKTKRLRRQVSKR